MPVKGRGRIIKYATIHPKGRRDISIHVEVVTKAGPREGHTVAGPIHRKRLAIG